MLDEDQQKILDSDAPYKAVVAGPGSGKTRLLVAMIEKECRLHDPLKVAVLTYSNSAADEIKKRLMEIDAELTPRYCGTLHSFLFMLLRKFPELSGLGSSIAVIEPETESLMISRIAEEMKCKTPISKLEELARSQEVIHRSIFGKQNGAPCLPEIVASEFHRRLTEGGLLTFDTLLTRGVNLVAILGLRQKWPYDAIFVDEVQDGAESDFKVIDFALSQRKTIVGDPDQSIYGFRGAMPSLFLNLVTPPCWETFRLEKNYRSSDKICLTANMVIEGNTDRIRKMTNHVHSKRGICESVECGLPIDERMLIASHVRSQMKESVPASEIAVLTRTRALGKDISDYLISSGIPVMTRQDKTHLAKDWKLCKLLLTVAAAPWSEFAAAEFMIEKEGEAIARKLIRDCEMAMLPVITHFYGTGFPREYISPSPTPDEIESFLLSFAISRESASAVKEIAIREGDRLDLKNLIPALSRPVEEEKTSGVSVLTIHSSKGLEFHTVIIAGAEEGTLPSLRGDIMQIEEERRLFFVAVTRAKLNLIITHCSKRPQSRGPYLPPGPLQDRTASRFIKEAGL